MQCSIQDRIFASSENRISFHIVLLSRSVQLLLFKLHIYKVYINVDLKKLCLITVRTWSIPIFFNDKEHFKKCNPLDFKFYLDKLDNKKIPHVVQC